MNQEIVLAADLARGEGDLASSADALADRIGDRLGLRMTIIAADGRVLGDSELDGAALAAVENHADRPEVIAALRDGVGRSIRLSRTIGARLLYVAARVDPGDPRRGVVRLAMPLTEVRAAQSAIRLPIFTATLVAVAAAALLGHLAARRLAGRLRALSRAASGSSAPGRTEALAGIAGRDEIADLARSFHRMAKSLEERLQLLAQERNRLRTVLDGMVEGVLLTDRSGLILLANGAFQRIFGAQEPIEGRRPLETARIPALQDAIDAAAGSDVPMTREINVGGDDEKVIRASLAAIREAGRSLGVVGVFHDITELTRLERVRREFVANVSHELRTPLTAIKGYAETLRDGALRDPEQAADFVLVIERHAERLRVLIEELLDLSAIEHGRERPEIVPLSLLEPLQQAAAVVRQRADAKRQRLTIDLPPDLPSVLADRQRLSQVVINLLDNAVKFTPEEGRIEVSARRDGGRVQLAVRDNGIGIPPEEIGRVFERFYRGDRSRDRREGGTGLGLAIAKHLTQAMGGTIEVDSRQGEGTTFRVILPAA